VLLLIRPLSCNYPWYIGRLVFCRFAGEAVVKIEGTAGEVQTFEQIAIGKGWTTLFTGSGAVFNARRLASFDAVVFLSATDDMLSHEQQGVFESRLENGGGWPGIHVAGDSSCDEYSDIPVQNFSWAG
jgi:hypothetical protein